MPHILLKGQPFSYTINRRPIRSLSLRFVDSVTLKISCPRLTPDFIVKKFIANHTDWILKNALRFSSKKSLLGLKSIKILDDDYEIIIKKSPRDSVVIFKEEHKIYANSRVLSETHLKKLFDTKFRSLALSLITSEIRNLVTRYNFHHGRITVRNTTSRFGSCSSLGNLNFNWQIILFPSPLFRHVLLHELTHTIHHNHSARFWSQLAGYDPNWRTHRTWLRREGSKHFIV